MKRCLRQTVPNIADNPNQILTISYSHGIIKYKILHKVPQKIHSSTTNSQNNRKVRQRIKTIKQHETYNIFF